MAAVILLQSSPKQTAKQPRPPVLSRLQLWKMPLQRESVGEYLWDPKSKWVQAETFLYTVVFIKYLLLWPLCPREAVYLCSHHCWEEQYFCAVRCRMQAELRFQPQLLVLSCGDSRKGTDLLQSSRPPERALSGWVVVSGHGMLKQGQQPPLTPALEPPQVCQPSPGNQGSFASRGEGWQQEFTALWSDTGTAHRLLLPLNTGQPPYGTFPGSYSSHNIQKWDK